MRKTVTLAVALCLTTLLTSNPSAGEDKKGAPDQKAQMEAMMKAATPGEPHKNLEALAGSWDVTVKMWMDPSRPPDESKATTEAQLIMGGRYLEEKVSGEFAGMKFLGQALKGYDNVRKVYTYVWIDNMGTGTSVASSGSYDGGKKTFTYAGEEVDPLDGKKVKTKSVLRVIDKDKYEIDMFREDGGKDVKVMHLDCTRKAAK
jgi:hypothetical protein